jgi:para-nitrobenzyl esterase
LKHQFLRLIWLAAPLLVLLILAQQLLRPKGQALELTVTGGRIRGRIAGSIAAFKGIPYAAPPVGSLRWQSPRPATPWEGVRAAEEFGPIAIQTGTRASGRSNRESEDCLTVNVWAPSPKPVRPLPVLVFVHGGRGMQGSGISYDGSRLAAKGAVVVTFNYRLGALGFLAHPAFEQAGNFGLMDTIQVLKWVQDNSREFGGNPARVLVFGQSSGGAIVTALLSSPRASGLFSSAIMQSAIGRTRSREDSFRLGIQIAKTLQCITADCLRARPAAEIIEATPQVRSFELTVDGSYLTGLPIDVLARGNWTQVPVIVGSNAREPREFRCYSQRVLQALSVGGKVALRQYLYSHESKQPGLAGLGAGHVAELPFVFGTLPDGPTSQESLDREERAFSDALQETWVRFAATGEADSFLGVPWPRFETRRPGYLEINSSPQVRHDRENCDD